MNTKGNPILCLFRKSYLFQLLFIYVLDYLLKLFRILKGAGISNEPETSAIFKMELVLEKAIGGWESRRFETKTPILDVVAVFYSSPLLQSLRKE